MFSIEDELFDSEGHDLPVIVDRLFAAATTRDAPVAAVRADDDLLSIATVRVGAAVTTSYLATVVTRVVSHDGGIALESG